MTASASAWQPAISYSLTGGALVALHLPRRTQRCTRRSQLMCTWLHGDLQFAHTDGARHLFEHGNMLSVFFFNYYYY